MANELTRLFHVSDIHFGTEDPDALGWFKANIFAEMPDAVICTGDLTQRATLKQYAAAQEWLSELPVPLIIQPGNLDMPYYNLWERFWSPYLRFNKLIASIGTELDLANALIVPLDTNVTAQMRWPWSDGFVTRKNLNSALSTLDRLRNDPRAKIIACHHPLLPKLDSQRNPTIHGNEAFYELATAGATLVLSGHVHLPFDQIRECLGQKMRMVGAGTLSTRLRKGVPPSYNLIEIFKGGAVEVSRRDFCNL